jgi:hypothetical protein
MVDVIQEEANRLNALIMLYDNRIEELPRGSLSEKERGNHLYCYLAYRDGTRVKFNYIGPRDSEKVRLLQSQIKQRRKYEDRRRESIENLKQIEKMINAASR